MKEIHDIVDNIMNRSVCGYEVFFIKSTINTEEEYGYNHHMGCVGDIIVARRNRYRELEFLTGFSVKAHSSFDYHKKDLVKLNIDLSKIIENERDIRNKATSSS